MTKIVKTLPIMENELADFKKKKIEKWIDSDCEKIELQISDLVKFIGEKINSQKWIYMRNKDVYYIPNIVALIPNLDNYVIKYSVRADNYFKYDENIDINFSGFDGYIPTDREAIKCFNSDLNYFRDGNYLKLKSSYSRDGLFVKKDGAIYQYNIYRGYSITDNGNGSSGDYIHCIPIFRLNGINSEPISATKTLLLWMKYDLSYTFEEYMEAYNLLLDLYKRYKNYLIANDNGIVFFRKKIYKELVNGKDFDFLTHKQAEVQSLLKNKKIETENEYNDYIEKLKKNLLECDRRRANLDSYDENILFDPNRGHWDLWDWNEDKETTGEIILDEGFTARNPVDDINHGIVGIDFGTKSTVVVYENEHLQTLPLQVGSGNYSKGVQQKNYENPTVIQFIDIDSFVKAYNDRAGRPFTSWNEVTVSHTAYDNLNNSNSDKYYSFFDSIKQWCGTDNMRIKLKDDKGLIKDLPPFMEVTEDDINPVEIYAYYLGLYINNMLQEKHIFLQYIMSFPVTYDRGVRERMRRSFEAGIRKSLPTALLSNENAMKQFIVQEGANEPAAYAITALEEYGFDPCDDDENYYAVFDFGGGTTDFDFGVFKEAEQDRYDYELIHFGANGDKTLGGENLLKLLAFEVFKANKEKLLNPSQNENNKGKIPFTWAAEKRDFAGSEALIKDSQEAHLNMHNLMEELRCVWEAPQSEEAQKILDSGSVKVNLFTDNGESFANMELIIPVNNDENNAIGLDLKKILIQRIDKGINNFFVALSEAFDKSSNDEKYKIKALSDVNEISIFLAGNSSKSIIVKELFEQYIGENGKAREILGFSADQKMPQFKLYPALGTEEAYKLMEEIGIEIERDNLEKPTGKTGVAFGLLKCRESGNVKVVDITPDNTKVQFRYYVGRKKKRKFRTIIDRTTKMKQWYAFIDASASFDLLYTDQPIAATNEAPVTIAKQIHVTIDKPDPEAMVYIRPIDSHTIEYAIAKNEDELTAEKMTSEPIAIKLE